MKLVRTQREGGKDPVLGEEVVRDQTLLEELDLRELLLLAIPLEEEVELGLEGILLGILVKPPEEGILLDLLEEKPRPELRGEPSRERRLPDADGALDRDVPPGGPVRRHPLPGAEIPPPARRVHRTLASRFANGFAELDTRRSSRRPPRGDRSRRAPSVPPAARRGDPRPR